MIRVDEVESMRRLDGLDCKVPSQDKQLVDRQMHHRQAVPISHRSPIPIAASLHPPLPSTPSPPSLSYLHLQVPRSLFVG